MKNKQHLLKISGMAFFIAVLLSIAFYVSATAMEVGDGYGSPQTTQKDLPPLGGEYIFDEQAGNWWYLHSAEEFDAPIERCNECHKAANSFFSRTMLCPRDNQSCRIIVDGDHIYFDCTGNMDL